MQHMCRRGVAKLKHWHRHGRTWRNVPAHARVQCTCVLTAIEVALFSQLCAVDYCTCRAWEARTERGVPKKSQTHIMGHEFKVHDRRGAAISGYRVLVIIIICGSDCLTAGMHDVIDD